MMEKEVKLSNTGMTEARWVELYKEWQDSAESQEEFCIRKGINYRTFIYRRKRHNSKQKNRKSSSFVEARMVGMTPLSTNYIRIILTSGTQIMIPDKYDKALLSDFLQQVGLVKC
jgi:hypothetical protein